MRLVTMTAVVVATLTTALWAREHRRVVVDRELLRRGYYYKGDCEAVGILLHCKDFWFEIDGYKPER